MESIKGKAYRSSTIINLSQVRYMKNESVWPVDNEIIYEIDNNYIFITNGIGQCVDKSKWQIPDGATVIDLKHKRDIAKKMLGDALDMEIGDDDDVRAATVHNVSLSKMLNCVINALGDKETTMRKAYKAAYDTAKHGLPYSENEYISEKLNK